MIHSRVARDHDFVYVPGFNISLKPANLLVETGDYGFLQSMQFFFILCIGNPADNIITVGGLRINICCRGQAVAIAQINQFADNRGCAYIGGNAEKHLRCIARLKADYVPGRCLRTGFFAAWATVANGRYAGSFSTVTQPLQLLSGFVGYLENLTGADLTQSRLNCWSFGCVDIDVFFENARINFDLPVDAAL